MKLQRLSKTFSVCKLSDISGIPWQEEHCFVSKTDEELSLVCETEHIPATALAREDGWRGFRIEGMLDFSMVGVLARIASLLAEHEISIFAVSTYNTDYIFTKAESFDPALALMQQAGFTVTE